MRNINYKLYITFYYIRNADIAAHLFKMDTHLINKKNIDYSSFNRFFIGPSDLTMTPDGIFDRKIDYKVRLDSLEEDYRSIDFIENSIYYKNGLLDLALSEKIGYNRLISPYAISGYNLPSRWQEYYNQETADIVYNSGFNYFETFGFEKDSWKK